MMTMSYTRDVPAPLDFVLASYINKTGAPSISGTIVMASTTTYNAVQVGVTTLFDPIGIIYEDGIPDGQYVKVVVSGKVEVLLEDDSAASLEDFVNTSTSQAGRAKCSAIPDGQSFAAVNNHFREIGHSHQAVTAGTNKKCLITSHFN